MSRIYVASSWRNRHQPAVVSALRRDGHDAYDFREGEGFSWADVDPGWEGWVSSVGKYLEGLGHPRARAGFARDMDALRGCDICVLVLPCGLSSGLEAGWAKGAGRPVAVYVPELREAELMVSMADRVFAGLDEVREWCGRGGR